MPHSLQAEAEPQPQVTDSSASAGASSKGKAVTNIKLKPIPAGGSMVVSDAAFNENILGGKSNNLQVCDALLTEDAHETERDQNVWMGNVALCLARGEGLKPFVYVLEAILGGKANSLQVPSEAYFT